MTKDRVAFALYRDLYNVPRWRFWLTGREKRAARELYGRARVALVLQQVIEDSRFMERAA